MSWQQAKEQAEGLAGKVSPSSPNEEIRIDEYLDPIAFRIAGGYRDWSWEFHRDVMAALTRIYSRRGFKVLRTKHGS